MRIGRKPYPFVRTQSFTYTYFLTDGTQGDHASLLCHFFTYEGLNFYEVADENFQKL